MNETDLLLEGREGKNYFPPLSVRECVQTLTLLPMGELRRTVNGVLVSLGEGQAQKFSSLITCEDLNTPGFEKLKVGTSLRVGCIPFFTQPLPPGVSGVLLERDPVVSYLFTKDREIIPPEEGSGGRKLSLPKDFPGGFVTYRPWLVMMVKTYHLERDEWAGTVKWRLELEEV